MGELTKAQRGLLQRMSGAQLLIAYLPPGSNGPHRWHIETPYSDEDGRTAWSIVDRKLVTHEGDGLYIISAAGRAALDGKP